MACVLTRNNLDLSTGYYNAGSNNWQPVAVSGTQYPSKEAAMADGYLVREQMGLGARLAVQDLVTGEIHAVPDFLH